ARDELDILRDEFLESRRPGPKNVLAFAELRKSVHAGVVRYRRILVVGYRVSRFDHSPGHYRAVGIGDSSSDTSIGRLGEYRRDTQQDDCRQQSKSCLHKKAPLKSWLL